MPGLAARRVLCEAVGHSDPMRQHIATAEGSMQDFAIPYDQALTLHPFDSMIAFLHADIGRRARD